MKENSFCRTESRGKISPVTALLQANEQQGSRQERFPGQAQPELELRPRAASRPMGESMWRQDREELSCKKNRSPGWFTDAGIKEVH